MQSRRLLTLSLLASACAPHAAPASTSPKEAAREPAPPAPMTLAEAGIVPAWLDRTAKPCDDFFAYACGGFLASSEIPPDRSSISAITQVEEGTEEFLRDVLERAGKAPSDPATTTLGDYYAACMDEAKRAELGATPLARPLARIATVKDLRSAARVIGELHAIGVPVFFSLDPTQDYADATRVIAALDQAGLGLPERKYYLENQGNLAEVRKAYEEHVARTFTLLGESPNKARESARAVLKVETALAQLQQDQVLRRDPHAVYHRIDLAGLEERAPRFPWHDYFADRGLDGVTAVTVHDPAYYPALVTLIERESPAVLRAYMTFQLLHGYGSELGGAFVAEDFTLAQLLDGVDALPPLSRRCVQAVDRDLGELLAQPYVAARFAGDARARAVELTRAVFAAMDEELTALPWMDAATRAAARDKLARMSSLIGYPDQYRRYDFAVSRVSHAENVMAAARFEGRRQLAKIGKPVDARDWQMTPPTVNAYYDGTLNQLVLPAGILQPPFFGATFHPAVNFGSTGGGTVGHEMTHGFDDEGSQFDALGNLRDWWSESTAEAFGRATQCVVDQYARYEVVPGVHLDGKLTAGENIADIGGVKLSYQAYRAYRAAQAVPPPAQVEGITDDQLYFLAYAQSWCSESTPESLETRAHSDPHSPARFRVNGVMVNQPGFREAYGCEPSSPMAPATMCEIW